MAKQTIAERRVKGLYWDRVWKINEGCTKVSPGCENCWSEAETAMRQHNPNEKISSRAKLVLDPITDKFDDIHLRHDNLDLPLRTKKPSVFAVWNDLFHKDVPEKFILDVYCNMVNAPQHTFLVLTKRPERMAEIVSDLKSQFMSHIHHGVTVCNQEEADRNIPYLSQVPGKRFLSIEPMLGPIDLDRGGFSFLRDLRSPQGKKYGQIHQVLLGGESGKNARHMHPEWVRSIRDQCQAAGVSFMFKQWGEWCPVGLLDVQPYSDIYLDINSEIINGDNYAKGEGVEAVRVARVGKKKAGRTLDGKIHEELIWDKKENK